MLGLGIAVTHALANQIVISVEVEVGDCRNRHSVYIGCAPQQAKQQKQQNFKMPPATQFT